MTRRPGPPRSSGLFRSAVLPPPRISTKRPLWTNENRGGAETSRDTAPPLGPRHRTPGVPLSGSNPVPHGGGQF
ncbi:unnamed protein product [Gadus morhua 'NCC']